MRSPSLLPLLLALTAGAASALELTDDHRVCFNTQKTIAGAVSMYNTDMNVNASTIPWDQLVDGGYLHYKPDDPGQGENSSGNFQLTATSGTGVACTAHGTPESPREARTGDPARQTCFDNQRTISGAVSMFNVDNNENVATIPWTRLLNEGYLHSIPQDPGGSAGSARNYRLTAEAPNGITCTVHGPSPAAFSRENLRRCLATQRMVSGAVELYNLDENQNVTEIPWRALVEKKYLGQVPVDPGGPPGSHVRYQLDEMGMRCSRHGSAEEWTSRVSVDIGAGSGVTGSGGGGVLGFEN